MMEVSAPPTVPSDGLFAGPSVVDHRTYAKAVAHMRSLGVPLPTFAELAEPSRAIGPADDPDALMPANLHRIHWYNGSDRRSRVDVPDNLLLTRQLTGVDTPILVLLGDRFPMIRAHKVLPAYACLVTRLVTGTFDPALDRAVWPSTGNFCRGGIAVSRALDCRGIAILPEGMSRERFEWLHARVSDPADVITTPGTESNVKEIYDACQELAEDPRNVILNQFRDFANYLVHFGVTGPAIERAIIDRQRRGEVATPRAFVAASGSAGTLAAGDYLKERFGTATAAVESVECPTMLRNGFGEHNIQGIGDKHIPLIHNVLATDHVIGVSDAVTDRLNLLFNTDVGRAYLRDRRMVDDDSMAGLGSLGLSSLCNIVAAIKLVRSLGLGPDDLVITIATDGSTLYASEAEIAAARYFNGTFDELAAAEVFGEAILGAGTGDMLELTTVDRARIFNLGYFTWVEQRGVGLEDFETRRSPAFWRSIQASIDAWDAAITEVNVRAGTT